MRSTERSNDIAAALSAMLLGRPDFAIGTSSVRFSQSTNSHLALVTSLLRAPVSSRKVMAWPAMRCSSASMAATRRLVSSGAEEALPLDLRGEHEPCRRVVLDPRDFPLACQVEHVSQQNHHAISGRINVPLASHLLD